MTRTVTEEHEAAVFVLLCLTAEAPRGSNFKRGRCFREYGELCAEEFCVCVLVAGQVPNVGTNGVAARTLVAVELDMGEGDFFDVGSAEGLSTKQDVRTVTKMNK